MNLGILESYNKSVVYTAGYNLNETSGNTVNDINGNYNGQNFGATIGVTGKNGFAYSFDGVNDYVDLSVLNGLFNATDWSWGFWFNTTQNSTSRLIQNRGTGSAGTKPGFQILNNGFSTWGGVFIDDGVGNFMNFSNVTMTENDGNWHFGVLTWSTSKGRARLYMDNVLKDELTNANMINANLTGEDVLMGKTVSNTHFYNGKLDTVIFDLKEWTALEISNQYNNGSGITL